MWNSGWILSEDMQLISYEGNPLQSDNKYFWKVQVKDEKGKISQFSETASWSTGLFSEKEWTAKWIGTHEIYQYSPEGNKISDPWLRKTFNLKQKPDKAALL